MAYLTSKDAVVNTFTVGKVTIDLKEPDVDEMGEMKWNTGRTDTGVQYKLIPGHKHVKTPYLYVKGDSEPCYLRLRITINNVSALKAIADAHPAELKNPDGSINYKAFMHYGTDAYEELEYVAQETKYDAKANTAATDYWYSPRGRDVNIPYTVPEEYGKNDWDGPQNTLFGGFTVPAFLAGEELATIQGLEMVIEAHAIQATGFKTVADAWVAFDAQK